MPEKREPMMTMLSMMGLYEELDWLRDHGALAGVMAIMRERRRQIETKGFTPGHDREHTTSQLTCWALERLFGSAQEVTEAGALAAAEIDRLDAEARKGGS